MRPVEPTDLPELARAGALIVDTRPWELAIKRPLEDAVHLPLERIQAGATPDVPRDATLVVVCAWGRKSALAGLYLEARGFTNVLHLVGGVAALPPEADGEEGGDPDPPTDATPGTEPR